MSDITRDEDKLDNQTSFFVADKLSGASSWLYNQGLAKAKIRDLSGAISFLKLSIKYNKRNIEARNLLGLVFFEIGEIVSALEQWVVSRHLKSEGNIAENYINDIQANQTKLDGMNQAITKYNAALTQLKQKSSDLAIIQLKKVLTINPNFIKAYCLLALVYIKEEDYDKAKKQLNRVLLIDRTNVLANRYLSEIEASHPTQNASNKKFLKEVNSLDDKAMRKNARVNLKTSVVMQFIFIVAGLIIGAVAVFVLVVPGITLYQKQQTKQWKAKYEQLEKSNANPTDDSLSNENKLNDQILQLQNDLSVAQSEVGNFEQIDKLLVATEYFMNDQITEAAEQILSISSEIIKDTKANNLYNLIQQDSFAKVVTTNYNLGKRAYDNRKYEEALISLKNAEIYLEGAATSTTNEDGVITIKQDTNYENVIYFIARCYHAQGENALAAQYYEILVNNYNNYRNYQKAVTFYNQVK